MEAPGAHDRHVHPDALLGAEAGVVGLGRVGDPDGDRPEGFPAWVRDRDRPRVVRAGAHEREPEAELQDGECEHDDAEDHLDDLDAATQRLLARGARLTELLKQGQFQPYPVEEQVVVIYAGVRGYLDPIPVDDVGRFELGLLDNIRANGADILEAIRSEKQLTDDINERLKTFLDRYANAFS